MLGFMRELETGPRVEHSINSKAGVYSNGVHHRYYLYCDLFLPKFMMEGNTQFHFETNENKGAILHVI